MELSRDTLLRGELVLWQPVRGEGYRFNLDPVFLAGFVAPCETVVDLGAGCGVLGLYLLKTGRAKRLIAIERIPEMAAVIRKNAAENGLSDLTEVICADLRELAYEDVGTVVFNPPYFRANQGRPAKNPLRDAGRFERHGTLKDFVEVAGRAAGQSHEVAAIVPTARADELEGCFEAEQLGLTRRRPVLTRAGEDPVLLMLAGSRQVTPGAVQEAEPLIIHAGSDGREFSGEVASLVGQAD